MTDEFDRLHAEIVGESEELARRFRLEFSASPASELAAWLKIALRREALVSYIYGEAHRSYRLPEPRCDAARVAWDALTEIWQQEAVHTTFIEVRLVDGALAIDNGPLTTNALILMGKFEGKLMDALTRRPGLRSAVAEIVTWLGRRFAPERVPEFALDFGPMDPRDFFLLARTLETTARQSYQRMEHLANDVADQIGNDTGRIQLESFASKLRYTRLEEEFHEKAFREMAGWVTDAGVFERGLRAEACAREIFRLLPRAGKAADDPDSPEVVTDGGLAKLFAKYGVHVKVVSG